MIIEQDDGYKKGAYRKNVERRYGEERQHRQKENDMKKENLFFPNFLEFWFRRLFSLFVFLSVFTIFICLFIQPVFAVVKKNFGTIGRVYEIQEEDFLFFIEERMRFLQENEELSQLEAYVQKKSEKEMDRPSPVLIEGRRLTRTTEHRSWEYNPSIIVRKNIEDDKGNVIIRAGTKVDPLDTISLSSDFLFFDGEDEEQIIWIKTQIGREVKKEIKREDKEHDKNSKAKRKKRRKRGTEKGKNIKLVLVNGSIKSQSEIFNRPVYFDQGGRLIARFGIEHVPARVSQKGNVLLVEELNIRD